MNANAAVNEIQVIEENQPQQQIATVITPAQMLSIAVEQGADLDKLEKLMGLQERWENKEAKKAFSAAISGFRGDCPTIAKTAKVAVTKTGITAAYAPLHEVMETIAPILKSYDLSARWQTAQPGNGIMRVTCIITHAAGHSEETSLESALETSGSKSPIQSIGSTISYLERYTIFAALGLSSKEMDDDGAQYTQAANRQRIPGALPPYPQERLNQFWDKWEEAVSTKKKTPADIISALETKHTLTDEQIAQLLELGANQ